MDKPPAQPTGSSPGVTLTLSPGHCTKNVTIGPGGGVTYGTAAFTGVSDVVFRNAI